MNVDTQFPPAPLATLPNRPAAARPDQASARPVDRPHHSEPADNQKKEQANRMEAEARRELATEGVDDSEETVREGSPAPSTESRFDHSTDPAPVGELIDVLV